VSTEEARMTFTEHLAELRTRIVRSMVAIGVAFFFCYALSNYIFEIIAWPLSPLHKAGVVTAIQPPAPGAVAPVQQTPGAPWTALNPLEPIMVKIKLAVYASVLLVLPFIMYQLCAFIFPGLKPNERKMVQFLLFGCAGFALFGVSVAYFGVLPLLLPYLMQWIPAGVQFQLRMSETVNQIILGLFGFAVAFQFPMVTLALVYLGLLTPAALKRYRRLAVVVLAIAAALLTPPDPISMMIMLIPMMILYEISIWMSYVVYHRRQRDKKA
jgi:sec-independent protein translocase protein TatC